MPRPILFKLQKPWHRRGVSLLAPRIVPESPAPTYVWWRVRSTTTGVAGNYLGLATVKMSVDGGLTDLALNKSTQASQTIADPAYLADYSVDGNDATFWTTGATGPPAEGHWLAALLPTTENITWVSLTVRPDIFREDPLDLFVDYSTDGSTWVNAWSVSSVATWSAGETRTFSSGVSLAPARFTNSQSFFALTVTPAAVGLSPSLVTNSNTFPASALSATISLTPALLSNPQTFPGSTIIATIALAPALLTSGPTFFGPTFSATIALSPALITNAQTFPAATVSQDGAAQALSPSLLTSSGSFLAATVTPGSVSLTASLMASGAQLYVPILTATSSLAPPLLASTNAFFTAVVSATITLAPPLVANDNEFFAGAVTGGVTARTYPLAGVEQDYPGVEASFPLAGAPQTYVALPSPTYPLTSQTQDYPLRGTG